MSKFGTVPTNDIMFNYTGEYKKDYKKHIFVAKILAIIILLILLFAIIYKNFIVKKDTNIVGKNSIFLESIDVTNMSLKDIREKLENEYEKRENNEYIFGITNRELKLKADDINFKYDIDATMYEVESAKKVLSNLKGNRNIKIKYAYDEVVLREIYSNVSKELKDGYEEQVKVDEEKGEVIIDKEVENFNLDYEEFKKKILEVYTRETDIRENTIDVMLLINNEIVLESILKNIQREAKNAILDESTKTITPEVNGIKFEKSIEEIKKDFNNSTESKFVIRFFTIVPEVTKEKLEEKLPKSGVTVVNSDVIYEGKYKINDIVTDNTIKNIENSIKKINGKVIKSGEIFSFNDTVGKLTEQNGFHKGNSYENGEKKETIGGGVILVSSGLYSAVLNSGFEIVTRSSTNLSMPYFEQGFDADITKGDMIFRNNMKNPIKIEATFSNYELNIKILGTKDITRKVVIEKKESNKVKHKTIHKKNENFTRVERRIYQNGIDGATVSIIRKIILNNNEVVTENISTNTYEVLDEIIEVSEEENSYINI